MTSRNFITGLGTETSVVDLTALPTAQLIPSGVGSSPLSKGVSFVANNSVEQSKIFSALQTEITDDTSGQEEGRLHFLATQGGLVRAGGVLEGDATWILGSDNGYEARRAGAQSFNGVPSGGILFNERLSCFDFAAENARVLALRNTRQLDVAGLADTVGVGFAILNDAYKEKSVGELRFKYTNRTDGAEASQAAFITYSGAQIVLGPVAENGSLYPGLDGAGSLGNPSLRWASIYASSGIYLGGTSTSNLLKDYEEGTWTPAYSGQVLTPDITYQVTTAGQYTKIGNLVHVSATLDTASVNASGAGSLFVTGLPFVPSDVSAGAIGYTNQFDATTGTPAGVVTSGSVLQFFRRDSNSARSSINATVDAGTDFSASAGVTHLSVTYRTIE